MPFSKRKQDRKHYNRVSTDLHNMYHLQLKEGVINIKWLVAHGVSRSNAYIIQAHKAYTARPYQGRHKKLIPSQAANFIKYVKQHPHDGFDDAKVWIANKFKKTVSRCLIRLQLRKSRYYSRITCTYLYLSEANIAKRLIYSELYYLRISEHKYFVFSDESLYQEGSNAP